MPIQTSVVVTVRLNTNGVPLHSSTKGTSRHGSSVWQRERLAQVDRAMTAPDQVRLYHALLLVAPLPSSTGANSNSRKCIVCVQLKANIPIRMLMLTTYTTTTGGIFS